MKLIIAIMILLMMWIMPASANDNGTVVYYDESKDMTVISGSAIENVQEDFMSLTVYYDKDGSMTYTSEDVFQYITTVRSADIKDGSYSFKLANLADKTKEADSGYYVVRFNMSGKTIEEVPFYYASKEARAACLESINLASSYSVLDDIVVVNKEMIGLDMEEYASVNKQEVLTAVLENRPQSGFENLLSFSNTLKEHMGCYALKAASTADKAEEVIEKYNKYFKIDTTDTYVEFDAMSESEKNSVYEKLFDKEYSGAEAFRNEFDSVVTICLINSAKRWADIKSVLENYAENLSIDLKYFNKCNVADLSVELAKKIPFNTKEDLYNAIKAFAEKAPSSSGGGGGSSSGSGGGGGSSSGGRYSYSEEIEIPKTEENTPVITQNDELKDYEWAREAVEGLMAIGAVKGNENGLFMPGNQISREEFLKILVEAFGLYESGKECDFDDVAKSDWAYSYIACAVDKGVVNGIGENRFGLGQKITRQDMAVMIERATKIANINLAEKNGKIFTDSSAISDYARGSVETLAEAGVINGYDDGSFKSMNLVIRAEAAVMIYNVVKGE